MINKIELYTLKQKRNDAEKPIEPFADWDDFVIKGYHRFECQGKRKVFANGLKGVESASLPLVQEYDMGRDSGLGQMISDLNKYFKTERQRVNKDYDGILSSLSYKLDQQYVPIEFVREVLPLLKKFPDQEKNKNIKAVSFVPYEEQIPAYKFEMVEYLCLASLIYGYREYALDNKERFLEKCGSLYKRGMPVLNKTAKKMQELLCPALQQLNNPNGPQNYVKRISKMRFDDDDSGWRKLVYMASTTTFATRFSIVLTDFGVQDNTPYERLVSFAEDVYGWREDLRDEPSGKYVMYPVLRLLDNALAPDVQMKADEIKKYQKMLDYFDCRADLVNKYHTMDFAKII